MTSPSSSGGHASSSIDADGGASAAPAGVTRSKRKRSRRDDEGEGEDADIDDGGGKGPSAAANDDENDDADTEDPAVPRRVGHSIEFPLSNLRPHLICSLCKGYFRDPCTVVDCLHTFCRSCLILFFRQGMRCCPTCNTRLGPDPFHTSISIQSREVIPDRALQEVVNKIFPWMKDKDDEMEREFYAQRGIELKPEYAPDEGGGGGKTHQSHGHKGSDSSGNKRNNDAMSTNDMLELHVEPSDERRPHLHQRLPPLRNSYLCMSGKTKIVSVKKYLAQKLGMRDSKSSIELLCNGDPMGDELSLTFILRTRWFLSNKVLTLHYRMEEEEDSK